MAAIYIHVGHGGIDSGACGEKFKEKDIALSISKQAETLLKNAGFEVKLSRESDITFKSPDAAKDANNWGADFVLSIHCNSAEDKSAHGTETCIVSSGGNAEKFANMLNTKVVNALKTTSRGLKVRPELAILNMTKAPAILLETAFISNEAEEKLLGSANGQKAIAQCICDTCCEYFGIKPKASVNQVKKETYIMYKDEKKIASWAQDGVKFCHDKKIMLGDGNANFRPTDAVTRQELAEAIENLYKALKG